MNPVLDALLTRRSVLAKNLTEPGPSQQELDNILAAGHRVPDHGKIGPWRFILFTGDARAKFGDHLASIFKEENPIAPDSLIEQERQRFLRAPIVIAVISSPVIPHKVPEWEQVLAAGAVCQNILTSAYALGYGSQWVTEWYAFNSKVDSLLGLTEQEKIAGYIYIGSKKEAPTERVRPSLEDRVTYWADSE